MLLRAALPIPPRHSLLVQASRLQSGALSVGGIHLLPWALYAEHPGPGRCSALSAATYFTLHLATAKYPFHLPRRIIGKRGSSIAAA